MSAAIANPPLADDEQRIVLNVRSYPAYVAISDAIPERSGLRTRYIDGRLTLLTVSRRHDWLAEAIGRLVIAVADGMEIEWETAGQANFRSESVNVGVEADKTFYLREHAVIMRGPVDIDLTTQPPPDLAVEVEVTHGADDSMRIYGRLGVPEVWRYRAATQTMTFWRLTAEGIYEPTIASVSLAPLMPVDVADQLRLAEHLGSSRWGTRLTAWVRDVLLTRRGA